MLITFINQKSSQLLTSSFKFQNLLFCDKENFLKKIKSIFNENTDQFYVFFLNQICI